MIQLSGDPKRDKEIIGFANRRNGWASASVGVEGLLDDFKYGGVASPEDFEKLVELEKNILRLRVLMEISNV